MKIDYYIVNVFVDGDFSGNPAGVCLLDAWLPDGLLQSIAAQNNMPETAFVVRECGGYTLRWFSPEVEVDLCGHATIAAASVLLGGAESDGSELCKPPFPKELSSQMTEDSLPFNKSSVTPYGVPPPLEKESSFSTKSGILSVTRRGGMYWLDFPARPVKPCPAYGAIARGLGAEPAAVYKAADFLVLLENAQAVRDLTPDFAELRKVKDEAGMGDSVFGIIVTAAGEGGCDFVSRFFAPGMGIDEDPATGRAHCSLIPFWSQRLGKKAMFARQLSRRGGYIWCEDRGERVGIGGKTAAYMKGEIILYARDVREAVPYKPHIPASSVGDAALGVPK